jgi:hypothetical protein
LADKAKWNQEPALQGGKRKTALGGVGDLWLHFCDFCLILSPLCFFYMDIGTEENEK